LLRNSSGFVILRRDKPPWQASLWQSPISAPVFADGLPGRKKGNQISLVAFVKPGGADVDCSALKFSSKNAVNPSFTLNIGTLWHNVTRLPASIFGGINGENHRLRGKKRGSLNAKQPISKRESNHHPY